MDTETDRILACSFCHRAEEKVEKLVAGPSIFICNDCVGNFVAQLKDLQKERASIRCGFCGKSRAEVFEIFGQDKIKICNKCLDVCLEIMQIEKKEIPDA